MERRDGESSPVTGNKGDDVITVGHQLVMCSGEGRDVGASALTPRGDTTMRTSLDLSTNCSSCTEECGATGGTHLYLDQTQEAVTSDLEEAVTSDLQEAVTSDLQENVTSDLQEAVTSDLEEAVTSDLEEAVTSDLQEAVTSDLEEAVTADLEEAVTSDLQENVTSDLQEAVTSDLEEAVTSDPQEAVNSDLEENVTSDLEEAVTSDLQENVTSDLEENVTSDLQENVTSDLEEAVTSDLQENATSDLEKNVTSDLEEAVTSDLQEVSCDDEEAFISDLPLWPGELSLPASAVPPQSRNTFECSRRQSAPGQLDQEDPGSESELQSRRPGIVEYFSSRKQRSVSHSVAGWKLFGKVPPKQSPSRQARVVQQSAELGLNALSSPDLQDSGEFEARQGSAHSSPTHQPAGQQGRRGAEFEPLSTTALILEDRPANLPLKSAEETQRHREQYEQMVAGAKRKELKEAQRREQQRRDRLRQEEEISNNTSIWTHQILPQWDHMRGSRRARDLWWAGLPPSVRGRVWSMAIGNELNITAELYEIFLSRAREKGRSLNDTDSEEGASPADRESSVELITRDVSRTFPSLCVFQKGGPYHDLLLSILGAYTCYRPDVGYVQGMSSMAALLVLNMLEVDAFISFSNLMNRPCQLAFCRVDHQQMLRYFGAFQVFLEETLPRLFLHFQSSGLTPDLYLMDWILSLYTKPLPLDVACRVWDVFFRDGEEFLFRTALGILRMYQEVLLELDLISIAQFLSRLPDEEMLSDRLFSCISATPMLSGNRKWSQVLSSCRDSERSS